MAERSIFDLDPDQLDRLLSIGNDTIEEQNTKGQEILADQAQVRPDRKPDLSGSERSGNSMASYATIVEQPGGWIGQYKLLSVLGEGGMGIVYLAEQEHPIRRNVALKVIKPGMDTKRIIARFEAERQALALLDHPNIAHVHDAGTTESGRPYFVMEYVKGLSITEHCDRHKLTIEDRLNLFRQICLAVHHAHQKGIIHRDIKPSNILVPLHGDQAVPKIIDFGVAKAMAQPLTQQTLTTVDSQLLGTPEYMSPEQAGMSVEDIDIRSDIYSLGVLLYVILTGVLPFDSDTFRMGGIEHIRKMIRETDPKTPSTRLSHLTREDCTQVAQDRQIDANMLDRKLRGDLDCVVMKCLEKDRKRRYESANDLAMDLKRYLASEPVVARPPTVGYRLQKAWQRNRLLYIAAVAVAVALMVGLIVAAAGWWQAILARANEAALRQQAEQQELVARRRAYASDMSLAQQALTASDIGRAVILLERQKPGPGQEDLRGWEWRYLWSQTRSNEHEMFFRGPNRFSGLEFSNDGRFLMWFTYLQGILTEMTVTDVRTRQTVLNRTDCRRAVFARRKPWLVFAQKQQDETDDIVFWDLNTRREIRRLPLRADVSWLGCTPDDRLLISLSYRSSNIRTIYHTKTAAPDIMQSPWELTVWELSKGEILYRQLIERPNPIYCRRAAISPDGQLLALGVSTVSQMGFRGFQVLRISDGSQQFSVNYNKEVVQTLTFSPDGVFLLSPSGLESKVIGIWDVATGESVRTLEGHRANVTDIQFTPDGKYLISCSVDQTIRLWAWPEGRTVAVLHGHLDGVDGLAISPNGRTFASRCRDGSVFLWPLDQPARPIAYRTLQVNLGLRPRSPVFTSDSRSIVGIDPNGGLAQWDVSTGRQTRRLWVSEQNGGWVAALAPDGTQAAILDVNGGVSLLDLNANSERRNVLRNAPRVDYCYFDASGQRLVTVTFNEKSVTFQTIFWDLLSGRMMGTIQSSAAGLTSRSVANSLNAWVVAQGDRVRIWSIAQPQAPPLILLRGELATWINAFEVSPDGHVGAAAYAEGYLRIWDLETAELLKTMRVFLNSPHSVTFSPDGRRLAASSQGLEAVKLWETATWQEVLTLAGKGTRFSTVAFSPDGQTLMAGNRDGLLHIWTAPSLETIEKADAPPSQTR